MSVISGCSTRYNMISYESAKSPLYVTVLGPPSSFAIWSWSLKSSSQSLAGISSSGFSVSRSVKSSVPGSVGSSGVLNSSGVSGSVNSSGVLNSSGVPGSIEPDWGLSSSLISSKVALTSTSEVPISIVVDAALTSFIFASPDTTSQPANLYPSLGLAVIEMLVPFIPDVAEALTVPLPSSDVFIS